ncbi:LysR family transcriptional regulator [Variovorax saccharolyticus]|uniref:LysR family transcriptional regulator n=1 Tax=Variovorax saccharolyticus TaxID=3053516 RepID=UPI002574B694|nr:LysR family transcriptional regulator [Variovorax sp. J22R187]MDM0021846.1 LysR family transcriptional regulator [Variovorax sp. J22R187]
MSVRENLGDLYAFVLVAREGSFTRAAARLGISQSALSHSMRNLEARLGYRLLTRTTRSVSPTEAGDRVLNAMAPRLDEIELELGALAELRDKPAGTIRITTSDHAVDTILIPKLGKLVPAYPDLKVEIVVDYSMTDIVAQRFDMGVRLGDQVAKDMIAVRIAPDMKMAVLAAPDYLQRMPRPKTPHDLTGHNCINLRLPTHGGYYAWEFEKKGEKVNAKVDGQWTFNTIAQIVNATRAGVGLAYFSADLARPYIDRGELVSVLEDWCPSFPGFHIYYPSRRQSSRVLALVVDALRYRN